MADADKPSESEINDESSGAEPTEPRSNGAREPRSTSGEHRPHGAGRPGQRNITGQAGLDEQATRLGRRVASFFDGTAPEADDEDVTALEISAGWQTRLVCLDVAAGGLQLEVGPLEGLPTFVKKLRVVGTEWDAFVLATNAKTRPTRASVRPGTGPWRWEAVGFEEEQDLGVDKLALEALDVTAPTVFRVDADGVGQRIKSTTLSLGQAYRLLLPPKIGDDLGTALDDGWRIWSLDLVAPLSPTTRQMLNALGIAVGEASPRLEWALAPAAAWRTNARGDSYPVFDMGTELLVNVNGVALQDGDEAMLFLHGPAGTQRLTALDERARLTGQTGGGAVGLCAAAFADQRAARNAGLRGRSEARPSTSARRGRRVHHSGLASLEAMAPPGWPVSVRWGGIAARRGDDRDGLRQRRPDRVLRGCPSAPRGPCRKSIRR